MARLRHLFLPLRSNKHQPHLTRPVALVAILLLVVGIQLVYNVGNANQYKVLGYATNVNHEGLLTATNALRTENGQNNLTLHAALSEAAQAKANDMVAKNYWAHVAPDGTQPWSYIVAEDYAYQSAGENLAYGFADSTGVVDGWFSSQTHRDNMLNAEFTEVGFGIASSADYTGKGPQTVIVALYAKPAGNTLASGAAAPVSEGPVQAHTPGAASIDISNLEAALNGMAPWALYFTLGFITLLAATYGVHQLSYFHHKVIRHKTWLGSHPLFEASLIYLLFWLVLTSTYGVIQ